MLELAMVVRKPTHLRWSEEAEANQVRQWAELDAGSPSQAIPPATAVVPRRHPRYRPGLLPRLRGLFQKPPPQIVRDEKP